MLIQLTSKQSIFFICYLETFNATEAATVAYNCNNRVTAASIGYENLRKPTIQAATKEVLRSEGLTLDVIVSNIRKMAFSDIEKVSPEVVLRACQELLIAWH